MNIRRVETESSVWLFDMDLMRYLRLPRVEAPTATSIPYVGDWEPFTMLTTIIYDNGEKKLVVHRPVPWGQGAQRMTGVIVHDSAGIVSEAARG